MRSYYFLGMRFGAVAFPTRLSLLKDKCGSYKCRSKKAHLKVERHTGVPLLRPPTASSERRHLHRPI
jgi:hypothetical protein